MSNSRVRYPWAMAPTINTTKLVATAIATFVSTDKFIISPFNYGGHLGDHLFDFPFWHRFEFRRADGCQNEKLEGRRKNYEVRSKKKH